MANKKKTGIRIGGYTVKPAGLILVVALIVVIVMLVVKPGADTTAKVVATPTPEVVETPEPTATPVPTPEPTATPRPEPRSATLRALPNIIIDKAVLASAEQADGTYNFGYMFKPIAERIGAADYTVAQVEGTLGDTVPYECGEEVHVPSTILATLKSCGVDLLNMSNDHAFDDGLNGVYAGCKNAAANGLAYVGAGTTSDSTDLPTIVTVNDIRIAFVSYTNSLNNKEKKADKKKLSHALNLVSQSDCVSDIRNAKIGGADVVVCFIDWGEENGDTPNAEQTKLAEALAKAGADIIIGSNPRLPESLTTINVNLDDGTIRKVPCVYSLGTLLVGNSAKDNNYGAILEFTLQEQDAGGFVVENLNYIPTVALATALSEDGTAENDTADEVEEEEDVVPAEEEEVAPETEDVDPAMEDLDEEVDPAMEDLDEEVDPATEDFDAETEEEPTATEEEPEAQETPAPEDTSEGTQVVMAESEPKPACSYQIRILPVSDWISEDSIYNPLDGMTQEQVESMGKIWAAVQRGLTLDAATVSKD